MADNTSLTTAVRDRLAALEAANGLSTPVDNTSFTTAVRTRLAAIEAAKSVSTAVDPTNFTTATLSRLSALEGSGGVVFASPLALGINNDVMDWFVDSSPLVDIANGDTITDDVSVAIPQANRDADGTVNSVPAGKNAVLYRFQIPGTVQPYKITWTDIGGGPSVSGIWSSQFVTGVTADFTAGWIQFTPSNSQVTDRSHAPAFALVFNTGKHPKDLRCRPVTDPGGVLDAQWQAKSTAVITANGYMRFIKLLSGVENNNYPIHEASGQAGAAVSSITFVGTTATLTTTTAHGLKTGHSITETSAVPATFNVTDAQIVVTGANTFTYTMAGTPTGNATVVGSYTWGDDNFQYPRLAFPVAGSEPGTLLTQPIYTTTNRNKNLNDIHYNEGVPIETIISIATHANVNAWFNAPWNADSTYYTDVANQWAAFALATGKKVVVELSLEVWNPGYKQFHQCANEAVINGIQQPERYAQKYVEMIAFFEAAFASAGVSSKLVRVLCWQNEASPNIGDTLLNFGTTSSHVDMLATASYYGDNGPGQPMALAGFDATYVGPIPALAAAISSDIDRIITHCIGWQAKAIAHGKLYDMYEGGLTIVLNDLTTMTALQTDSTAYDNELRYLQQLEVKLGSVAPISLNSYSFIFPIDTPNSWGLLPYLYAGTDKISSPKYKAHTDFITGVRVLGDATASLSSVAQDAAIGASLGFITASAYGVTQSLFNNDGGRLAINGATGEVTVASSLSGTGTGSRSITDRQTLGAATHDTVFSYTVTAALNNHHAYRYYQVEIDSPAPPNGGVFFRTLQIAATLGGADTFQGKTVTATDSAGGFPITNINDGDDLTLWADNQNGIYPKVITGDYGATAGNWIAANEFRLTPNSHLSAPANLKFLGSDDGITFTPLKTLTSVTWIDSAQQVFTI